MHSRFALIAGLLLCATPCLPSTLTVTTTADTGAGSLRDTLANANNGDTIIFAQNLSGQVIYLTSGELMFTNFNITIDASALTNGIFIDAGKHSRVLDIVQGNLTLKSLTLTNGNASGSLGTAGEGGGVLVNNGAGSTLFASNCTFTGNSASQAGGAIMNSVALVTLYNCTVVSNTSAQGGGIEVSGNTSIYNCTVYGNSAGTGIGGGITWAAGGLGMTNTIVAGNTGGTGPDFYPSYAGGNNFIGGNPKLAPLGNYGGPTPTMPPLSGSPVINAGADVVTNYLKSDQRGYPRLAGAHVDIGAVEAQTAPANNPPVLTNVSSSSTGAIQFGFTNIAAADFTVLASTNINALLANWKLLGNAAEIFPGQFQFTDTAATNGVKFYRVVSP